MMVDERVENRHVRDGVLIVLSKHDFSYNAIKNDGFDIDCPYRGNSMPIRLLRELAFRCRLPGRSVWYNRRINKGAKLIIVYNALITVDYMYWLRKHNPSSRIIYLYTDAVDMAIHPDLLPDSICEKWSSDYLDCEKYGLHRGKEGGYFKAWQVNKATPAYDVFYIGRDKGRMDQLLLLKTEFERLGLRTNFYITAHHRWQRLSNALYRPLVPYQDVLTMLGNTRAILHLTKGGYKGMSIRVLESIIHGIKLITDNTEIKKLDIYRRNNFFILGEDNLSDLPAFLDTPYDYYDKEYLDTLMYERVIGFMAASGDESRE